MAYVTITAHPGIMPKGGPVKQVTAVISYSEWVIEQQHVLAELAQMIQRALDDANAIEDACRYKTKPKGRLP